MRSRLPLVVVAFTSALLLGGGQALAQTCNPFVSTVRTTVAPDPPFTGLLQFLVSSSGCAGFAGGGVQMARSCINSITLTPSTTIQQKCTALVNAINTLCGTSPGSANFQADGTNCANGTFTVTDLTCNGQTAVGTGTSIMLGNGSLQGSGFLPDYEQDTIVNGCTGTGDSLAVLGGTPMGAPINGNQSSVIFVVSTPNQGTVIQTVLTSKNMSTSSIVSQVVGNANLALTALQSNVRCKQDAVTPTIASCAVMPPTGDTPVQGVPVTFQVNDAGLNRFVMAGPSADMQAARKIINTSGGVPDLRTFNFVGGSTCSPCGGGLTGPTCCLGPATVPAVGNASLAILALVLVLTGLALTRHATRAKRGAV
jgi:hypothetical protein